MITYVFPGQGSQSVGMGKELFPQFPELLEKANDILGYKIDLLCLQDDQGKLNNTQYTQPALYTVNALTYYKKLEETGNKPDYVAGHSLGEYNALLAAGVFDFTTGLQLVKKRGELMAQAENGGMAAIVGISVEDINKLLQQQASSVVIANYNTHMQTVISGAKNDVMALQSVFTDAGALFIPLKVSGAFHSPYMQPAEREFASFMAPFKFAPPDITTIANTTAEPYPANNVKEQLAMQITHAVQWTKSIEFLLKQGEMTFVEVGPGAVLTGLIRRIQKGQ